jgi:hypothetical protein
MHDAVHLTPHRHDWGIAPRKAARKGKQPQDEMVYVLHTGIPPRTTETEYGNT